LLGASDGPRVDAFEGACEDAAEGADVGAGLGTGAGGLLAAYDSASVGPRSERY